MTTADETTRLEAARALLLRERAALVHAREEFAELEEQLRNVDPDGKGFGALVTSKAQTAARCDAFEARSYRASAAVSRAEELLEAAQRAAAMQRLEQLRPEIARRDLELQAGALAALDLVVAGVGELAALVGEANALANQAGEPPAGPGYWSLLPKTRTDVARVLLSTLPPGVCR